MPIRIKRLADELKMRRRRLDTFRNTPPWPGKARDLAREEAQCDHCLVVAARMLEVPVPEQEPTPGCPLPPEVRAVPADRLGGAGLNVFGRPRDRDADVRDDGDPIF